MMLEDVAKKYGMYDYYDNMSGRIFHLGSAYYDECNNQTVVPVSECGKVIGTTRMEGNYCG